MIFSKSIERKTIKGTDIILIMLIMAVSDIDRATSPSANLVSIFDVTPPGAADIRDHQRGRGAGGGVWDDPGRGRQLDDGGVR